MSGLRLAPEAAQRIRSEIERAGGREVCFLADVDPARRIVDPRAVARGNMEAVLVAARDAQPGGLMIHNHPSGDLEPSTPDLSVAGRIYERGLGTAIVDNAAERLYVVVEPPEPRIVRPLDLDALDRMLAPGGVLAGAHPGYEDRPAQRSMLRVVAERFNDGGVAVVEAGTGTGKSLAYLLPAARWALENGERTVVSTNTINLQEQLVGGDLPLVARLLGDELDWSLVKGRGNYVSIRRARLAAEQANQLFEDERGEEIRALLEWTGATDDGSLSDLTFVPSDEAWDEVRSDADICLRSRCPHFDRCFYQRSRRRAATADVLVVNHHLLFTDLSVRRATGNFTDSAVLPPYRRIVLDEAHNLEDAATSHLGVELSRIGLRRTLSRLDRGGKGILSAIDARLGERPDLGGSAEMRERIRSRLRPSLARARSGAERFFEALEPVLPAPDQGARRLGTGDDGEPASREPLGERLERLLGALSDLAREVKELRERVELDDRWSESLEGRVLDLGSVERRLAGAAGALRLVLRPDDESRESHVRWIESRRSGRDANPVLAAAPVEPGRVLRDALFQRADTAVLSSATLTTRGRFDFFRERVGLDEEGLREIPDPPDVRESALPSPFDFANQTVFAVPTDLPGARSAGDAFDRATARVVEDLVGITGGGVFVLFTSHRALRAQARLLRERGVDRRHPLFVHGEAGRARLLRDFVDSGSGVLLGTASFWEGVDVPGRPLRALVLQKLPFRVPNEPVTEARLEALERKGRNPFWSYMLPLAALRLKQGFGRLVRSRTDRGAILLLDDRILRKRYGRYLRDSLPDAPLRKGPWPEVVRALREFYDGAGSGGPG